MVFLHPDPTGTGRAGVQRACPRIRLRRHRQNHRRPPPRRPSGAHQSRCPRSVDNILGDAGQRAAQQAAYSYQLAAAPRRTGRSLRHRCAGREALPPQPGRVHAGIIRTNRRTDRRGGCRRSGESKFSTSFILTEWERVVDAWQLDTWDAYRIVPASRPPPQSARNPARGAVDHIRERASGSEGRRPDHPRPDVRPAGPPFFRNAAVAVRFCHRRRVPGCRRITAALSASPEHRQAGRSLLRRRSGPAHLPAALLVAGARHRNTRAGAHPQSQLPHLASDQKTLRPPAGP